MHDASYAECSLLSHSTFSVWVRHHTWYIAIFLFLFSLVSCLYSVLTRSFNSKWHSTYNLTITLSWQFSLFSVAKLWSFACRRFRIHYCHAFVALCLNIWWSSFSTIQFIANALDSECCCQLRCTTWRLFQSDVVADWSKCIVLLLE